MRAHDRGFLVVFVASACLSTLPTAVKIGLTVGAATPLQLLAPRMVIGSSFIGLYLLLRRSGGILIDRRGRQSAALAGVFNLLALLFFYWALRRIDAAVGMLVFSTYPALLLGVLALRGESITRLDWTRLAMALLGIALVSDLTGDVDPLGIFFAVVCATFYALYMLVIHTRLVAYPATSTALWITGTMGLLAYLLIPLEAPGEPVVERRLGSGAVVGCHRHRHSPRRDDPGCTPPRRRADRAAHADRGDHEPGLGGHVAR